MAWLPLNAIPNLSVEFAVHFIVLILAARCLRYFQQIVFSSTELFHANWSSDENLNSWPGKGIIMTTISSSSMHVLLACSDNELLITANCCEISHVLLDSFGIESLVVVWCIEMFSQLIPATTTRRRRRLSRTCGLWRLEASNAARRRATNEGRAWGKLRYWF